MSKKLSNSDGQAVDLVLDRVQWVNAEGSAIITRESEATSQSIEAARRVLALLHLMPTQEPPVDLVSRTMALIDQTVGQTGESASPSMMTMLNSQGMA